MITHTHFARRLGLAFGLPLLLSAIIGCAEPPAASAPAAMPAAVATPTASGVPTATPTASPTPIPDVVREPVNIFTEDGVNVAATLFPNKGALAVLLVHMSDGDQTAWKPVGCDLAVRGYAVLEIDLQGYGGTQGLAIASDFPPDVLAAKQFLADKGYARVACVGADVGGALCMKVALQTDFVALGIIASPINLLPDDIAKLTMPKLFVSAEHDAVVSSELSKQLFQRAPEPKQLAILPGWSHGMHMLDDPAAADQLRSALFDFLQTLKE